MFHKILYYMKFSKILRIVCFNSQNQNILFPENELQDLNDRFSCTSILP